MFRAVIRGKNPRRAGFFALLTLACLAGAPAHATDTVAELITGSISPSAQIAPNNKGSAAFQKALGLVDAKDYAGAYALARGLPDATERRAVQWAAIYFGNGDVDYRSVEAFAKDAPDYASPAIYKTRLEQGLIKANADGGEVIRLLAGAMPNTIKGQIALAAAYRKAGKVDRATRIARSLWVDNFLDRESEDQVRAQLGDLLTRDDHWTRAVHLMMNDRAAAVERLLPDLSKAQASLAIARNAVSRKASDAKALLDKVDPSMQSHPVFIYSRAQRARQAQLWSSAVDWLNKAKGDLPDAEEWWYERRTLIRQMLNAGQPALAFKAADTYRNGPEGRQVEAHFHAGWIALSFLNDAASARAHFAVMAKLSTLPDSVTQAQYWLGRAELALGDRPAANAAFKAAAAHGTVYYGLLAKAELGDLGINLRALPAYKGSEAAFESHEVVRAVRLLAANDRKALAQPLLRNFAMSLKDGGQLLLAARLAQAIDAHHLAISIADVADRRGAPLDLFSFPKDGLPVRQLASVDTAAVYAIARQESKFQVDAVSSVGARGLMQLMPGTAKDTAKKVGVDYSESRLTTDPAYNALLGSTYLAGQLQRFDGSLVLAAAAYNAGAGNAAKWVSAYGDPRAANVDPVVWVELIPFQETRKYVQRVVGNYLVYRARLGMAPVSIKDVLHRLP